MWTRARSLNEVDTVLLSQVHYGAEQQGTASKTLKTLLATALFTATVKAHTNVYPHKAS